MELLINILLVTILLLCNEWPAVDVCTHNKRKS